MIGVPPDNRSEANLERYTAGADIRGCQEGRPYPRSQQVIHEISGLEDSDLPKRKQGRKWPDL